MVRSHNVISARVAKLADAPDLGSGGEILRGSSPLPGRIECDEAAIGFDVRTKFRAEGEFLSNALGDRVPPLAPRNFVAAMHRADPNPPA